MKRIRLHTKVAEKDWSMHFVDECDYHTIYNEDVYIEKPDGSPLLVLKKQAIAEEVCKQAWPVLKKIRMNSDNRSVASGTTQIRRKKQDGTISNTQRVPKGWGVMSAIIGFYERTARVPFCRSCAWNEKNPSLWSQVIPFFQAVSKVFEEHVPDRFAVQKSWAEKTSPDYVIPGTVYTTITVNHNYRTACHKDAGDLAEGFSNMAYLMSGKFKGGDLILPEWGIAVKLEHRDVVMFDAHEFHGNTRIIPLSKDYDRCTTVCYYRENIINCLSQQEELKRVQNRKQGEKLNA
jgi:hypothetical protein